MWLTWSLAGALLMARSRITAREHEAIVECLTPAVRHLVREFGCSATTVGRMARVVADGLPETPRLTVAAIQDRVAKRWQVSRREMVSNRRPTGIIQSRHVAMYLARELTTKTLPQIARAFNRDHTTVLMAVRKIERLRQQDPKLDADVKDLIEELET